MSNECGGDLKPEHMTEGFYRRWMFYQNHGLDFNGAIFLFHEHLRILQTVEPLYRIPLYTLWYSTPYTFLWMCWAVTRWTRVVKFDITACVRRNVENQMLSYKFPGLILYDGFERNYNNLWCFSRMLLILFGKLMSLRCQVYFNVLLCSWSDCVHCLIMD